jgi:sulfur relay (sulfurtransferase) complex TusBCD TusD component (DsrE family)
LSPRLRQLILLSAATLAGLFIIVNAILWVAYRNRTYPRTSVVGTSIGSTSYTGLSTKIGTLELLPKSLTFTRDDKHATRTLADMGISKDIQRTVDSANRQRSWLPIVNLFKSPQLKAPVAVDSKKMSFAAEELAALFRTEPVDAHLTLNKAAVGIVQAKNGYELEKEKLPTAILRALDDNAETVTLPTKSLMPQVSANNLQDDKKTLEQQLNTPITFTYNDKNKQASTEDVAGWFVASGEGYVISQSVIRSYLAQVGEGFAIHIKDSAQVAATVAAALTKQKAATVSVTAQTALKTFTYCTAVRGVATSNLATLLPKLKSTYDDSRGWSLDGLVEFKEATSGCDYTVWISASSQMASFGGVCDSDWSCRSGNNVVINYDRWTNASDAWNASGGSLDEYRSMVINHETGHWLGFSHRYCGGPGQPAPVMQQQSINLQGCTFNAWPTAAELSTLHQTLGI